MGTIRNGDTYVTSVAVLAEHHHPMLDRNELARVETRPQGPPCSDIIIIVLCDASET
jgi:hypothetical protein